MRRPDDLEERRDAYVAAIPGWHRWWFHLLTPLVVGGVLFVLALRRMQAWDFAWWPGILLIANFIEWYYHKNVMHHRARGLGFVVVEHVGEHHALFTPGHMAIRSARELHAVLLAPVSQLIAYAIAVVPAVPLWLILPGLAYAWVSAAALYLVTFELLHALYHLPVYHLPLGPLRWLKRTHELHHDPASMQRHNFNVTVPLWDVLLGTYRPALEPGPVSLERDHTPAA
jgi:hypothetical protein